MAITPVGAGTPYANAGASTGTATITLPALQAGDVILVQFISRAAGVSFGTPDGYTLVRSVTPVSFVCQFLFRKVAVGAETTVASGWTGGADNNTIVANAAVFRGVDPTTPLLDIPAGFTTGDGGDLGPIAGMTPSAGAGAVYVIGGMNNDATVTALGGAWEPVYGNGSALGADAGIVAEWQPWTSGAVAAADWTVSGSVNSSGIMISLTEAATNQSVTLPHIASTATLFAPTASQNLTLPAIATTVTTFAPLLAVLNVVLPRIESTAALFGPTVGQNVALPHIGSTAQVFAPSIVAVQEVELPQIASTVQTFAPTTGLNVALPAIAPTAQAFAATVNLNVALPHIASTAQVFASIVGLSITLPFIASTATVAAPTVGLNIALGHIASTVVLFAPSASTPQLVALPHIAATVVLYALAVALRPVPGTAASGQRAATGFARGTGAGARASAGSASAFSASGAAGSARSGDV